MKTDKYRFQSFTSSRGECIKCEKRENCFLIRIFSPFKIDLRICYPCLIGYGLRLEWQMAAKKRKEKKEEEREENERKLLADSVAGSEGGKSETKKENGQSAISDFKDSRIPARKGRRGRPKKQK